MKKYLALAVVVMLVACKKEKKESMTYTNDAEQMLGWCNYHTLRGVANAHSGGHVSYTDSAQVYSLTLREKMSVIKKADAARIIASAWVNPETMAGKGSLILSVDGNNKNYFWKSFDSQLVVKQPGKWYNLTITETLPADLPDDALLSVFFWNTSKLPIMVDDIEVRLAK